MANYSCLSFRIWRMTLLENKIGNRRIQNYLILKAPTYPIFVPNNGFISLGLRSSCSKTIVRAMVKNWHRVKNIHCLIQLSFWTRSDWNGKQDGRLAPAYFSQEHKYFDQHLPTVKNETIVWNLVCESFPQTSIPLLISIFYAKEFLSRLFVQNFLSHSTEKFRWGTLRCIRKFRVAKNFMHQRGGYQVSSSKTFCHTVPKNFLREYCGASENFVHRNILCIRRGYH